MSTSSVRRWLLSGVIAAAVAVAPLLGSTSNEPNVILVEGSSIDAVVADGADDIARGESFEWD